jgi:hypothetical protein
MCWWWWSRVPPSPIAWAEVSCIQRFAGCWHRQNRHNKGVASKFVQTKGLGAACWVSIPLFSRVYQAINTLANSQGNRSISMAVEEARVPVCGGLDCL